MRVAYFSPLPPARSGIADYSEALIASLRQLVELDVFSSAAKPFDPAHYDATLYQVGNNGFHDFVYETALRHPGVAVMHESNLHHLIADLTIKRGNWDAYVAECEFNGGATARAFAERGAEARSRARLRGRADDAASARCVDRRGGAQPLHGRGDSPRGFRRARWL